MKKFAVMSTNLSDNSDFKAKLVALADTKSQALTAAENYIQSVSDEHAEMGVTIEVDEWLHAADETGGYSWQMSIQEIELDAGMNIIGISNNS